ncbi:hypothetical protein [Micromonospora sp. NPDC051141]|uniref:hypothetical protein n=1 Tax=Micromonospora sp. NPDC051141 TaxID=3364284 RepID=UPI0037961AF8
MPEFVDVDVLTTLVVDQVASVPTVNDPPMPAQYRSSHEVPWSRKLSGMELIRSLCAIMTIRTSRRYISATACGFVDTMVFA